MIFPIRAIASCKEKAIQNSPLIYLCRFGFGRFASVQQADCKTSIRLHFPTQSPPLVALFEEQFLNHQYRELSIGSRVAPK